ncbi:MAG TPA: hypothetical protein VL137_02530, partial [Polyangiaceae bacterium]|nr:hypothetical protein [Polyangiaceae bacterium]
MNQARVAAGFLAVSILSGCGAVFPEVSTPLHEVPASKEIKPSPPADLMFLRVAGAHIPAMTRDGRTWKDEEGSKPDPFAVVYVGGKEVFRTRVESNTLDPS